MAQQDIKYKNIEVVNRKYAGSNLKGFDFIHNPEEGDEEVLATIYSKDLRLAKAIDEGLKAEYGKDE